MKIRINASDFATAVAAASRAVPRRSVMPVLDNLQMVADDTCDLLEVTATDLDMWLTVRAGCRVVRRGKAMPPAKMLASLLARLSGGEVEFEADGDRARLAWGTGSAELPVADPDQYPGYVSYVSRLVEVPVNVLDVAERVAPFADDETTPTFTGVLVEATEEGLNCVATDTHRLAVLSAAAEVEEAARGFQAVVPARAWELAAKVVANRMWLVFNQEDRPAWAEFTGESAKLRVRCIEAKYPNWRTVFPVETPVRVRIEAARLRPVLERAMVVAGQNTRDEADIVELEFNEGSVTVRAKGDAGRIEETVTGEGTGSARMHFNVRYLLDALRAVGGTAEMVFKPDGPVCVMTGGDGYRHLIVGVVKMGG